MRWIRHSFIKAEALCRTFIEPMYSASRNRMISLLKWDIYMFVGQFLLYYVMLFMLLSKSRSHVLQQFLSTLTTFSGWEAEITYAVVKILYALSAFPFFFFTIGPLTQLFTHTEPTAYTRDGRLVAVDTTGLSAYLNWFKEDVLGVDRFSFELDSNFSRKDVERIKKAISKSEHVRDDAWKRPATALKVTRKKKAELDSLLRSIITKDVASEMLYRACFPDSVLIERFVEERDERRAQAKEEREEIKSSKKLR